MKIAKWLFLFMICGSVHVQAGMQANAEWDSSADFYSLKTYAWLPNPPERMTYDQDIPYMLIDPRLKGSANIDLRLKGYQEVAIEDADFLIGYHITVEEKTSMAIIDDYYGYAPNLDNWGRSPGDPGFQSTYVEHYKEGTLILDIVNPDSGELIWRGYVSAVVDRNAPLEKKTEIVQEATGKILAYFASREN